MSTPPRLGRFTVAAAAILVCVGAGSAGSGARVNLTLTQAAYTNPVVEGQPLVYGLQVINPGATTATQVKTHSHLPKSVGFLSADPGCRYVKKTRDVVCDYGVVPPNGGTATLSFSVVPKSADTVILKSNVKSREPDTDTLDNGVITTSDVKPRTYDLSAANS